MKESQRGKENLTMTVVCDDHRINNQLVSNLILNNFQQKKGEVREDTSLNRVAKELGRNENIDSSNSSTFCTFVQVSKSNVNAMNVIDSPAYICSLKWRKRYTSSKISIVLIMSQWYLQKLTVSKQIENK